MESKLIIVNGDDFGMDESVTSACIDSFSKGFITDVSFLANMPYSIRALLRVSNEACPPIKDFIGIHFNLTAGSPLTPQMMNNRKFVKNGVFSSYWKSKKSFFLPLSGKDKSDILAEFVAQGMVLVNNGFNITHADSHQHIHFRAPLLSTFSRACKMLGITKVRRTKTVGNNHFLSSLYMIYVTHFLVTHFVCPSSFGNVKEFHRLENATTEIMVHPDYVNGVIINRMSFSDGVPSGISLDSDLSRVLFGSKFDKISYKELK